MCRGEDSLNENHNDRNTFALRPIYFTLLIIFLAITPRFLKSIGFKAVNL